MKTIKRSFLSVAFLIILAVFFGISSSIAIAQNAEISAPAAPIEEVAPIESEADREIERSKPISKPEKPKSKKNIGAVGEARVEDVDQNERPTEEPQASEMRSFSASSLSSLESSENLLANPSVEEEVSPGVPSAWKRGGWGTNNRSWTLTSPGYNSDKALRVEMTERTNGDAKWFSDDVSVTPGKSYTFSDYYMSDVSSIILVRYTKNDGTFIYKDVATVPSSDSFTKTSVSFIVPEGVKSASIFHLITQVGYLVTDNFVLVDDTSPSDPSGPTEGNLISNPDFEDGNDNNGIAHGWKIGGWGTNMKIFSAGIPRYDRAGNETRVATVFISNYTSGDAKWYFDPVPVSAGVYTYSDEYKSDINTIVTVQYQHSNGSYTYKDIAFLDPTATYKRVTADFIVPDGVEKVTVFHLIKSVGGLSIDNVSLVRTSDEVDDEPKGIFKTGAVSLRFDDGWLSQYDNALPKLKSAGLKGTFYMISERLPENGFVGYVNEDQIREIYEDGNEIGSHTKTHPHLSTLTPEEQREEIIGSRQDLLALNVGPIDSFSYPFGDYDSTTLQIVKEAGYSTAASTIGGYATQYSVDHELERHGITNSTTVEEIKGWIDGAAANKKWLILSIHEVNDSGRLYSITPEKFNEVIDYLKEKDLPVVTISEGSQSLE